MQSQEWIGLAGVAVGGCLTYLTQFSTARLTSKNEDRRRADQRAESRRKEQLDLLREFIDIAQQSARIAEQREYDGRDWIPARTKEWRAEARGSIDRLFVAERMIQTLFSQDLHQLAWNYATAIDHVMWREREEMGEGDIWDLLQQPQREFLAGARKAVS